MNAGELKPITSSDGTTPNVAFTYDSKGERATATDGAGSHVYSYNAKYEYGPFGEVIRRSGTLAEMRQP